MTGSNMVRPLGETSVAQRPRLRWLAASAIVAGYLTCCYTSVQLLSSYFYFSRRVVLLHMLLVAGAIAGGSAVTALAMRRRRNTSGIILKIVPSAAAAIAFVSLSLLYLGDFVSNYFWGDNLNYQIVREYWTMALPNRAPFYLSWSLYGAAAVLAVAIFIGNVISANIFVSVFSNLQSALRALSHGQRRALGSMSVVAILVYAGTVAAVGWSLQRAQRLGAEPIVGFFVNNAGLLEFSEYAGGMTHRSEGASIRSAYPRNQSFAKKNVVLIVVDSLRADHMGTYAYGRPTTPFLSQQLDSGRLKRVDVALSTCAETNCGVMSTLASREQPDLLGDDFTLDQLLHDQGYFVYRLLSGDHNWHGLRRAYGNEQSLYFDSTNSSRFPLNDDRVLSEALEHVPDYNGTPAFFQFHLMSVHSTGIKHEPYQLFHPSSVRRNFDWLFNGDDRETLTNTYDNGVVEADATIATLFEQLSRKGYLANSLAIVMADHGEGLGERGPLAIAHMNQLYQEDIRIPLLIVDDPDVQYRNLALARQIDVAPTIVDRLGLAKPSSWEGHSLLDAAITQYSFHRSGGQLVAGGKRWHGCYALVDHEDRTTYKYLQCGDPPAEELYDLTEDPGETRNLSGQAPQWLMDSLRTQLRDRLIGESRASTRPGGSS